VGVVMQRAFMRRGGYWSHCGVHRATWQSYPFGGALGLAGPVSRANGDLTYNGMDPSDPRTWVRPYNPQPGMCALFNFDPFLNGAEPQFNTATGLASNARPRRNAVDRRKRSKRWGEP